MILADITHSDSSWVDLVIAGVSIIVGIVVGIMGFLVHRSINEFDRRQDDCDKSAEALDEREAEHHEECLRDLGDVKSRLAAIEASLTD